MLRLLYFLAPLLLLGCRGSQPYTQQDLAQVKQGWAEVLPTYLAFKHAFLRENGPEIVHQFHIADRQCRLMDAIDARDTIDPNVQLFQASFILDDLCDAIDSGYVTWAKPHRLPYPVGVQPGKASDIFGDLKKTEKDMRKYLLHPDRLS